MDKAERIEFINAMRKLEPTIRDYAEALYYAMESVSRRSRLKRLRMEACYFGTIGDGTFYADSDPENTRWFPDTNEIEARGLLAAEFGEDFADELDGQLERM